MAIGTNIKIGNASRLQSMLQILLNEKPFVRPHIQATRRLLYKVGAPADSTAADEENTSTDIVIDVSTAHSNLNPNAVAKAAYSSVATQDWSKFSPT